MRLKRIDVVSRSTFGTFFLTSRISHLVHACVLYLQHAARLIATVPCTVISRTEPDRRRRRAALDAGADALELDLHLTRDGVLVAAHAADAAACTDAVRCLSA